MKTGFKELDELINLDKSNFVVVAGSSAIGKSSFILNVATNLAKENNTPLIINLELSKELMLHRILAIESMVETKKVIDQNLTDEEQEKVFNTLKQLEQLKLCIEDQANLTIEQIEEVCIKQKKENDIKIVLIDYLQLINGFSEKADEIIVRLKELSKKLQIPIIVTSQLSRKIENRIVKRPRITDFVTSKKLVEVADIIMLLYRDDYYNPESECKSITEIRVVKNTPGDSNNEIVELIFLKEYMKFINIGKYSLKSEEQISYEEFENLYNELSENMKKEIDEELKYVAEYGLYRYEEYESLEVIKRIMEIKNNALQIINLKEIKQIEEVNGNVYILLNNGCLYKNLEIIDEDIKFMYTLGYLYRI